MATDVRSIQIVQTGDADFRAWVAAVIAQLVAVGLTQTADTGQIDTGTVTRPGTTNTQAGYVVFRFNDTAHATRPLFFRLGFGTGSAVTTPSIWFTLGTGSDGAGNITGVLRTALQRWLSASNTSMSSYACYDATTGIVWAQWLGSVSTALSLIIARSCDPVTEIPDDKGVVYNWTSSSGDMEFIPWTTAVAANMAFTSPPAGAAAYTDDNGAPVVFRYWGYCVAGEIGHFTLPGLLLTHTTTFPSGLDVTVAPAGADRVYKALTHTTYFQGTWGLVSTERLLQVWE